MRSGKLSLAAPLLFSMGIISLSSTLVRTKYRNLSAGLIRKPARTIASPQRQSGNTQREAEQTATITSTAAVTMLEM